MDAVKFLIEAERLCRQYPDCHECPLYLKKCHVGGRKTVEECRETVAIIEKWGQEHPVVTNGMKVHEMIPGNERRTVFKEADPNLKGCGLMTSEDYVEMRIRKSWWDAEYKEESNG